MKPDEIISVLRSNVSRLIPVVDNREMERIQEATEEAVQDVNKTRAVKPFKEGKDDYMCPLCYECVYNEHLNRDEYCPSCGQALDWGDD